MFEIAAQVLAKIDSGERVVIATAVEIIGSAPRTVGTSMAVTESGTVIGSISGGCVEGAVYELCRRVFETGVTEVEEFGFDDDAAFAVGLSCGGQIRVLAELVTAHSGLPSDSGSELQPGIEPRSDSGPESGSGLDSGPDSCSGSESGHGSESGSGSGSDSRSDLADAPASTLSALRRAAAGEPARCVHLAADGTGVYTETSAPPARFIVFGAVEFGVALANAAAALGYRVSVCDARPVFATPERFPSADEVVVQWPTEYLARTPVDERTVICILTHDERFDVDLIEAALALDVAYVGAMGSRSTHEARVAALADRGISDLARLHSPIGLDLGASSPEETAISILAEVLAERTGASGARLVDVRGAIHRPAR